MHPYKRQQEPGLPQPLSTSRYLNAYMEIVGALVPTALTRTGGGSAQMDTAKDLRGKAALEEDPPR